MRVIMTIIWTFLIVAALNYVLTSMNSTSFDLNQTITYSIFAIIAIFILDGVLTVADKE